MTKLQSIGKLIAGVVLLPVGIGFLFDSWQVAVGMGFVVLSIMLLVTLSFSDT